MNLFIVGWNRNRAEREKALDALHKMHEVFPLLDPGTLGTWSGARAFAAWTHASDRAAQPRRYVHATDDRVVFFDGILVNGSGRFKAHDATELGSHWGELSECVEGRFAAVRIEKEPETLEILNDPLGIQPVFVHQNGSSWWMSNSALLLAQICNLTTIDAEAMAMFVQMQAAGGDRSLVEGLRTMPPGQDWRWREGDVFEHITYAPISAYAECARRRKRFGMNEARGLAEEMGSAMTLLAQNFNEVQCPLTAGRDSRMMAALLMANRVSADYFTVGDSDDADMKYGSAIAERFGLPHRRVSHAKEAISAAWDDVCRRLIEQNDGSVTLMHARNVLDRPGHLDSMPIGLYGVGGELARGFYLSLAFVVRRPGLGQAVAQTCKKNNAHHGLILPDGREIVRQHVDTTCRSLHEQGFAPVDIVDAFDVFDANRKWAQAESRQVAEVEDVFMPFLTRPYVRAAFSVRPADRLMERLPYQLLQYLSPALRDMPGQSPWPPQNLSAFMLHRALGAASGIYHRVRRRIGIRPVALAGRDLERHFVLDAILRRRRDAYLDHQQSTIWRIIDRRRFEHLTSSRVTPREKASHLDKLYRVLTLLEFEAAIAKWTGGAHP